MKAYAIKDYKRLHGSALEEKQKWFPLWDDIIRYINMRISTLQSETRSGEFIHSEIFDSTAPESCEKGANVMAGMLWQGGDSIKLEKVDDLKETTEIKSYFEKASKKLAEVFNDKEANFLEIYRNYLYDQLSLGNSGVGVFKGGLREPLITFKKYGVDTVTIKVDYRGKVTMLWHQREVTIEQMVQEFGEENVSKEIRDSFNNNKLTEKVKVTQVVHENFNRKIGSNDNRNMLYTSVHYEEKSCKKLKHSGYHEMPIEFNRYFVLGEETYGRSPGGMALPDTLEVNHLEEYITVAVEKKLDPTIVVTDDGVLGGGTVDTSAGGMVVANIKGRAVGAQQPIYPLFTVGNIEEAQAKVERKRESIKTKFNIDRLLDFATDVQMTLGEAQIREKIRGQSLITILSTQMKVLNRLTERTVGVLFRENELGYLSDSEEAQEAIELGLEEVLIIPDEVAKLILSGKEFYKIKHNTPAQQLLKAPDAQGVMETWDFVLKTQNQEMAIWLDPKKSLDVVREAAGGPASIIRSSEQVEAIMEEMKKAAQKEEELRNAQAAGGAAKDMAGAAKEAGQVEGAMGA